ncbi:hypothetical protein D777_00067 [Marinobacter nitratireducens]|uniref:Uncharacterized protein n=1 Tax=Marinobacter nitratireducens TaxID=1137280 RepID=A0A072N5T0_9GAMM|nr:hypothetical protein D777_00067 [Marinobacter nitratireducens]
MNIIGGQRFILQPLHGSAARSYSKSRCAGMYGAHGKLPVNVSRSLTKWTGTSQLNKTNRGY